MDMNGLNGQKWTKKRGPFTSIYVHLRPLLFCLLMVATSVQADPPANIRILYNSLDPTSVAQSLAFYTLYPQSAEGHAALQRAWFLLAGRNAKVNPGQVHPAAIHAITALVNKHPQNTTLTLHEDELLLIEKFAARLPNRKLRGHNALSEEEVLALPPEEIDLARGLFLAQLVDAGQEFSTKKMKSYEALIDLIALQILARLPAHALPEEKIRAINAFVFEEMGFRFPPHSIYAKNIDLYTFLPSVLDSQRGVCLGVSILYICIAQRLNLPLEMVTPPGHIYVRYRSKEREINIETTARGIHVDSEEYLSIDTKVLQQRNIKEVIGLAYYNQASVYWSESQHEKALTAYQKARKYLPEDKQLQELLAYQYLFTGREEEGRRLLAELRDYVSPFEVSKETIAEDYLNGVVSAEGIKAVYMAVDETRDSILKKKDALVKILDVYPHFRAGLFHLAVAWLQLHREGEALDVLSRYTVLEPGDPTAEYYLMVLCATRWDYNRAWKHLRRLEQILHSKSHSPKILKDLRKELAFRAPE